MGKMLVCKDKNLVMVMTRSIIVSLLFFATLTSGWSQNLVPNPSFECGIDFCYATSDSKEFGNYACHWLSPTAGTSDILSMLSNWTCQTSAGHYGVFGFQLPRTGQRFAGIFSYQNSEPYRDYLQVKLDVALIPGELYCAELYTSRSDLFDLSINNLGFYFHDEQITRYDSYNTLEYTPQIFEKEVINDTSKWIRIGGDFIATSASKHVTIGNFFNNSLTTAVSNGTGVSGYAYYFIDDVSVEKLPDDEFVFSGNTPVCEGDSVKIFASIGGNVITWTTLDDTLTIVASGSSLKVIAASSTSYRVKAYGCGKVVKDTIEVTVLPRPQINLGPDVNTCTYSSFVLDAGPDGKTYLWSDHSESRYLPIKKTGEYSVKVKDENGCINEDSVNVVVQSPPEVDLGSDYFACDVFLPLKAKPGDRTFHGHPVLPIQSLHPQNLENIG